MKGGQQLSHYKILSAIGAGGMAEVFLAEDTRLHRRVALKILPANFAQDAERMRRFVQEATSTSALNHPNIITIYEIGETDNQHFIVTEYIEGETLRERINQNSFALNSLLDVGIQIASALQSAHSAQIVHRDIKPENVMIRPDGLIKILDFGIAKLTEQKLESIDVEAATTVKLGTIPGMIIGTANYMSPEQARGKKIDARSDIFSFGIVLYEMLCGRQPFTGETMLHTLIAIAEKEPPPLSNFVKDYPVELERIIFKTLAKNRDERYQAISNLVVDLQQLKRRLEFEVELKRSSPQNEQRESKTQIFNVVTDDKSVTFVPNNFTDNSLPIVGRENEIKKIGDLLQNETVRLVTMTGIGGTGKTTLAKAVAHQMLAEFADGVFFVELAAVTDPELVASTIALSLDIKETGNKSILEILKNYLRDKNMLLVIDNFEQVADAAKQIAELIANTGSQLKILITSRMLLRLSSEREFIVPPLSLPSDPAQLSVDELSNYEAIKLFVERAQNAKPNFALTNENAQSIVEICKRLDGLPLAIELAAARVKILSPKAILSKLEKSLKVLTGGATDLPARQQTMRGAVEWSYDLLTEDEKRLFRRLSVFAGGFTFEAAEAVCVDYELDKKEIEVLEIITSLVEKSLVVSKEQPDSDLRFRLLEVVREYALESLEMSSEMEVMCRSHAEYFLTLGEEAETHLQTAEAREWLNRLEVEHDNSRAAIHWLFEKDAERAARLVAALRIYLINHSHLAEGREWLETALEQGDGLPATVRFKLLNGLGYLALSQGDYLAARKMFEEDLAEGRMAGDKKRIAESLRGLGSVAQSQDDRTAARKFHEEGLAIHRELNDIFGIACSLNGLVVLALDKGDSVTACTLLEESLTNFRLVGNESGICYCLLNLGEVAYINSDYEAAQKYFGEVLTIAQSLGYKDRISFCLNGFAALAAKRGEWELAARLAGTAEHLREQIGYESKLADRQRRKAYLAELKTKMDEPDFAKLYEQGRKMKLEEAIMLCVKEDGAKINR